MTIKDVLVSVKVLLLENVDRTFISAQNYSRIHMSDPQYPSNQSTFQDHCSHNLCYGK